MSDKDYLYKFRRKMDYDSCDLGDIETKELRETFNAMLDGKLSATVHDVIYKPNKDVGLNKNGIIISTNVTDVSKNDQKSNDEKYFDFKWDSGVGIGDEVYWDDTWWILYHKDRNSVMSHKTFTAKKCNFEYKLVLKDEIFVIPVLITNLTLYSDGMSDKVYMTNQNGTRRITLTDNKLTKYIKVGTRIMLTNNTIFEVTHIDDFSRTGVKDCIMSQVFVTSLDNKEDNYAYNDFSLNDDNVTDIKGSNVLYIGSSEVYTTSLTDYSRWEVESVDNCINIDKTFDGCRLICTDDSKYINTKFTLKLIKYSNPIATKEITIKGMF